MMWAWAHGRQEKRAAGIRCRPDSRAGCDLTSGCVGRSMVTRKGSQSQLRFRRRLLWLSPCPRIFGLRGRLVR